ncbi:ATP-binding cassette domain-containing protein [Paenibacillus herberti]|uniref:Multidrug ABC transporter ATP-binding protein n=1 Tax=Paenibacillus herberti TaxID=1619309 RepID=A0A229P389_9BACL|nr:ATP-binding cassette domain-containing protein [Paenibacillus herberti]OXM16588.1 multidrug ABC transporter ATP-binding protein [Paenibacillus herberti]
MTNAIELNEVNKRIAGNLVLNNISLKAEKGKIHAFYGANGSGKSMLFRAICGLIKPTGGEVIVEGKKLHKERSFPESIGVVIESPGFWQDYTGLENLKMLASIRNRISHKEVRNSLMRVGLDPNDSRKYKKYSLGMKQRLAIAQAIMEEPRIIILDEPTNALDEDGIELIRQIIREEKERGATFLIASHNKEDIELLADYKYRMVDGRLKDETGRTE